MADTPRKRKGDGRRTIGVPRSEAQRQQSRANGAKSRGPKTEAGKAASSENALVHGFSGKMLVPKAHRRVYRARSEAFGKEAGSSSLLQGLAGYAALAMTQTETLCDSRNKTADKKARRIRTQANQRQDKRLRDGLRLWESGKRDEAVGLLSGVHAGCRLIAEWWSEIHQATRKLAHGARLSAEAWGRIDQLDATFPEDCRRALIGSFTVWRSLPALPIDSFRKTVRAIEDHWMREACRLLDEFAEDLDERVARAYADLGNDGRQRHRYLQASQNLYRQSARQILDERRRRESPSRALNLDDPEPPPPSEPAGEADLPRFGFTDGAVGDAPILDEDIPTDSDSFETENDEEEDDDSPIGWPQISRLNDRLPRQVSDPDEVGEDENGLDDPDSDVDILDRFEEVNSFLDEIFAAGSRGGDHAAPPSEPPFHDHSVIPASVFRDAPASPDCERSIPFIRSEWPIEPVDAIDVPLSPEVAPIAWACHPDGSVSPVEARSIPVRNEPENSTQQPLDQNVAETSPANRGVISGERVSGPGTLSACDNTPPLPTPFGYSKADAGRSIGSAKGGGIKPVGFTLNQFIERLELIAQLPGNEDIDRGDLLERFKARFACPIDGAGEPKQADKALDSS